MQSVRALPDHSFLDRIVRGRAWIPLLGVMLAGIVAMQVEVLKYGASIGRSLQRSTVLQSRNELLRADVSGLSDDRRIERIGAKSGMVMPQPASIGFVHVNAAQIARAVASVSAPNPQAFGARTTGNGSVTSGQQPSATGAADSTTSAPAATTLPASAATAQTATSPSVDSASSSASSAASSTGASSTGVSSTGASGAGATGAPASSDTSTSAATSPTVASGIASSETSGTAVGAAG